MTIRYVAQLNSDSAHTAMANSNIEASQSRRIVFAIITLLQTVRRML